MINPKFLSLLRCPVDGSPLQPSRDLLISANGRRYPVIEGVPVLLPSGIEETIGYAGKSLRAATSPCLDPLYLETVGMNDKEREGVRQLARQGGAIDPVVSYLVSATGGNAYRHLVGKLHEYPIPEFRVSAPSKQLVLDLGCNWGRWCMAAAKKGFVPVGIDPQLGAVLAGKRVSEALGLECFFVCGDARHLPLAEKSFDLIFSYSVLQHLSQENVQLTLQQASKAAKPGAQIIIQMPNQLGVLPLVRQFQRRFRQAQGFEVRYWSLADLRAIFGENFDDVTFEVDCFFGIGLQASDEKFLRPTMKCVVWLSECLRKTSKAVPLIKCVADSVYVCARKKE